MTRGVEPGVSRVTVCKHPETIVPLPASCRGAAVDRGIRKDVEGLEVTAGHAGEASWLDRGCRGPGREEYVLEAAWRVGD